MAAARSQRVPGAQHSELLRPEGNLRVLLRRVLTWLTVLAAAFLAVRGVCADRPDLCRDLAAYVPSWLLAMEPLARQMAPLLDVVLMALHEGWQRAKPELDRVWQDVSPGVLAVTNRMDLKMQGWPAWQIAAASSMSTLLVAWIVSRLLSLLEEINSVGLLAYVLRKVKSLPGIRGLVQKELGKVATEIWESVSAGGIPEDDPPVVNIPQKGVPRDKLQQWLTRKAASTSESARPGQSRMSGAVYFSGDKAHANLLDHAYKAFTTSNPIHPDAFPATRRMEAEVVQMTAGLMGGGPGGLLQVCGLMTSGGTESILSAIKASRDFMMANMDIRKPEMVIGASAHPAYFKAASYFGIKLVKVPVDKTSLRLTAAAVEQRITRNTVVVVASAPGYPHGVMDDIGGISSVVLKARCLLHVDACLGGFVLPFAKQLGYKIPPFDFSLPGVTSMSVDTHKFGLAHKGTSVALFRGPRLRQKLYTAITEWSGGPYISPGMPGSRSGALIATAWASMVSMGMEGYQEVTKGIMETAKAFAEGITTMKDLEVMGEPEMSVVAFRSANKQLDIYLLNDLLSEKGWHLSGLHLPPGLHMCFTASHSVETARELLADISYSVGTLLAKGAPSKGGSAKLYGMASSLPDRRMVGDILEIYQDIQLAIY